MFPDERGVFMESYKESDFIANGINYQFGIYNFTNDGKTNWYELASGIYKQTIKDFSGAIKIKPGFADYYNNRSLVYLNQGDNISDCPDAQKACESGNCKLLEAAKGRVLCH